MRTVAVVLTMSVGSILAPAAAASAGAPTPNSAIAVFSRLGDWPAGYVGSITVTNHTATTITGWRVEFDLAVGTSVTSSHGGVFTRTGDHYVVVDAAWNGTLTPGASTTFGWVADGRGEPANCTINGTDCAGVPLDYTAPTRPGPLTFDTTAGLALDWAPSSDDGSAVAYQVYESGRPLATVTANRYVYSTGATLPPRIYVFAVRAIDASGNASMLAYRTLGQIWRGDEVPAAPSDLRTNTVAPGLLRFAWTAPPSSPQLSIPPIAGYEVYVDGVLVGQVGNSAIILPTPATGTHTLGVRAVNAVDQPSAIVELIHMVS